MPIRGMLEDVAFSPEEIGVLVAAFESCCAELGLKRRDDPIGHRVAKTVIQVGKFGASNVSAVRRQALLLLQNSKPA